MKIDKIDKLEEIVLLLVSDYLKRNRGNIDLIKNMIISLEALMNDVPLSKRIRQKNIK